ncbi:MAG: S9 family peptidase, partial [Chitinophagaceae bacterium]|nr:S9 family peptidase [Chitinophagaceae bacterium]
MKKFFLLICAALSLKAQAQNKLTPEKLWQLGRVSGIGISKDNQLLVYSVGIPDKQENRIVRKTYLIATSGGESMPLVQPMDSVMLNSKVSPDGKYIISTKEVKLMNVTGAEKYPDLPKSNVYVYDALNYRHWDTWEDGKFEHVFVAPYVNGHPGPGRDLMPNEPYDCPQKPFGGDEDFIWNPDSRHIVYVAKKKAGTEYAVSTNTDLYEYDVETGTTRNLTEDNKGYDVNPAFSKNGTLAWLQMKHDGYEADKQDIIVTDGKTRQNLTAQRDDIHVESFVWSAKGDSIFFIAPINGTLQVFSVNNPIATKSNAVIRQVTAGDFDISAIVGQDLPNLFVARNDMNHATEIYRLNTAGGRMAQLTHVNDTAYARLGMAKTERRFVTTTDNKKMLVWVIYPPGFDPAKKYPTLLYCQGGPQSPLTQSYSFRWNFQLMASQGYIVVAPARRGMPGFGTQWNEQVSKDWGGQVIKDYLSAIDAVAKEPYVDKDRLGCVGASFGGFSVFALESQHEGRFKTFIAHDGVFDFRSMY